MWSGGGGVAREACDGEREGSEELDDLVPLDRLPAAGGDFRGKFRKMRPKKRPTILEMFLSTLLSRERVMVNSVCFVPCLADDAGALTIKEQATARPQPLR
ncbi:hypothetical protein NHX12_008899 [Muraenolepis orangiensis]|uniref:Uncharacterized protein n=1 Tax=Muraenolepis orangiensis TaxID=630683 RepID=A0A9Q0IBN6_9TELE|nr:hypothetical protein NHX12_008899 [Muraenolepis orangiensis]